MRIKNQKMQDQQQRQMVDRAWVEEKFKQRLLAEPVSVMREYGLEVPAGLSVKMLENTDQTIHLILPARTKGSEAPAQPQDGWGKLWAQIVSQAWKDEGFKKRLLARPASVLTERLGQQVPAGVAVQVHEDTDALIHLVLPAQPPRSVGELTEAEAATVRGGAFTPTSQPYANWSGPGFHQ